MPKIMKITARDESPGGMCRLEPVDASGDAQVFGIDQSAPDVRVYSMYGCWQFNQSATPVVVGELRKLADSIEKGVAL
jgi:hypothetical protein